MCRVKAACRWLQSRASSSWRRRELVGVRILGVTQTSSGRAAGGLQMGCRIVLLMVGSVVQLTDVYY